MFRDLLGSDRLQTAGTKRISLRAAKVEAETVAHGDVPAVAVAKAATEELSHALALTAEFKPFQEIDVMAKVAGYVKEIKVDVGDRVQQGQLLATLEIPEMADDLARARAAVERSSAEVARARDEIQRAESAHRIAHLSHERLASVSKQRPGLGSGSISGSTSTGRQAGMRSSPGRLRRS